MVVLGRKKFSDTFVDKYVGTIGSLSAENDDTNRKNVSLKGLSLPLKPRSQSDTLYKQCGCGWDINLRSIFFLNISQAQNLKGDLRL